MTLQHRWNHVLDVPTRIKIARAAGFSESDCALIAKIYWQGFPAQLRLPLIDVDWKQYESSEVQS